MPGLLSMDPTAAGLMALGGNMVRGDFGGGLLGFNQAIQGAQEANMRGQLGQAQIADMQQQIELRKQQAAQLERRNSLINNWLTGTNPVVGAPGSGVSSTGPNGAPMPGPAGGGMLGGVPQDALMADLAFNDGKNIGQWSYDRNKPNIEFINGVAVDKNRVLPGASLPQMSPTGQGYQIMPDPSSPGGFRVIMPQGADQVYGRFKAIDAGVNAQMTPEKVVSPDGSERYVTRAQVLSAAQGGPTAHAGADADRYAILTQELAKAQASGNAGDVAAIQREIARLPASARTGVSPSGLATGPFQASPTTEQAAARAKTLKQAESDVRPTEQRQSEIASGNYMLSVIDRALNHPGLSEATGLQGALDPRNYIPGTQAKDFQAIHDQLVGNTFLQAYANLKGGGQITEIEGKKAQDAIARLNRAQSTEAYRGALTDLRTIVFNGIEREKMNLSKAPVAYQGNGASGSFSGDNSQMVRKQTINELPKTAAKGARVRDTQTGKVLQFNGLSWVEVK